MTTGLDGKGLGAPRRAGGKGLANMHTRAVRLGGSLQATTGLTGTVIDWRLPARPRR